MNDNDSMGFQGVLWDSMGFYGILWDPMGFYVILRDFTDLKGIAIVGPKIPKAS